MIITLKNIVKKPKYPWKLVLLYFYFKDKVVILSCFKKRKDINTYTFQFQNYNLEGN